MPEPIEIHFWPTPNGLKIAIAVEEMGLPYEIKITNINRGDQFRLEFLAISPNNRMPAIVDPDGPDGKPISVFESGAILQYLGRKSGQFYPKDERGRVEVEEWLIWQVANLGPMAGQASHYINYAPKLVDDPAKIAYGRHRYICEYNRLLGVIERRLTDRDYLADDYSIADMAAWPWSRNANALGQDLADFPRVKAWVDRIAQRPAVERAIAVGKEVRAKAATQKDVSDAEAAKILFGQTSRSVQDAVSKQP